MKPALSLILLFVFYSAVAQQAEIGLERLDWILGSWERQNGKPEEEHFEKWWKVSDRELRGIGVVTSSTDTVFVEKLGIVIRAGRVYYVADVPENPEPVYFAFTQWEDRSFVSENPEHDAPKRIAYRLEDKTLTVSVGWDKGGFDAVFKKMD